MCTLCGTNIFTNSDLIDTHAVQTGFNTTTTSTLSNNKNGSIMPMINGHRSTLTKCACLFL